MRPKRPAAFLGRTYFMDIADLVARRSTCIRRSVGAIIVKGQAGAFPPGTTAPRPAWPTAPKPGAFESSSTWLPGSATSFAGASMAEQNAIIQAALHGVSIDGANPSFVRTFPAPSAPR